MPTPIVVTHIAERRRDAALRRNRVASRRKNLGQTRGGQARLGQTECRAEPRAAGAHHNHIVGMVDESVIAHNAGDPSATRKIAHMLAPPMST